MSQKKSLRSAALQVVGVIKLGRPVPPHKAGPTFLKFPREEGLPRPAKPILLAHGHVVCDSPGQRWGEGGS